MSHGENPFPRLGPLLWRILPSAQMRCAGGSRYVAAVGTASRAETAQALSVADNVPCKEVVGQLLADRERGISCPLSDRQAAAVSTLSLPRRTLDATWAVDLFKSLAYSKSPMDSVRTSLDIPRDLHRRLHEAARLRGCSARQMILESIERAVLAASPQRPKRRLSLDPAPVSSRGHVFDLSPEQIHELIEFP